MPVSSRKTIAMVKPKAAIGKIQGITVRSITRKRASPRNTRKNAATRMIVLVSVRTGIFR